MSEFRQFFAPYKFDLQGSLLNSFVHTEINSILQMTTRYLCTNESQVLSLSLQNQHFRGKKLDKMIWDYMTIVYDPLVSQGTRPTIIVFFPLLYIPNQLFRLEYELNMSISLSILALYATRIFLFSERLFCQAFF